MGGSLPRVPGIPGIGNAGNTLFDVSNPIGWGKGIYDAVARGANDPGGAKNTASNALTAQNESINRQNAQAADIQKTMLMQPKNITPDNFLATKSAQLANLRLGLAGTVTGAGSAPGAVLGSTSLTGNYLGKTKLGQ